MAHFTFSLLPYWLTTTACPRVPHTVTTDCTWRADRSKCIGVSEKKFIGAKKYNTMKSSTIIMHAWSAGVPNLRNEMEKQDESEIMNHDITVTTG